MCSRAHHRAWIVAAAATAVVAWIAASAGAQSTGDSGKKKGGASWKIPPSAPPAKPVPPAGEPAAKPDDAPGAARAPASGSALGDVARLAQLERAKEGQDGPWNESIHLYNSSPSGAIMPVVRFTGASSPSVVASGDSCTCFFVQYPVDDPDAFARLVCSFGTDGGVNWTHPRAVVLDQMPVNIEGPLHPSVARAGDADLVLCFIGRTAESEVPHAMLMSARSADQGLTWTVDAARLDLGDIEVIDLSCVAQGSVTHALLAVKGEPGLRHASRQSPATAFEHRSAVRLAVPGFWRGGCAPADGAGVEFWGAGNAGDRPWLARASGPLADWKYEAPDAGATPIIPDDAAAVDIASTLLGNGGSRMTAAVIFEAGSRQTPSDQSPDAAPQAPPGEGSGLETAPSARKISDPIEAPRGLEVQPLGGKRPPPAQPVPGPTTPPIGGRP